MNMFMEVQVRGPTVGVCFSRHHMSCSVPVKYNVSPKIGSTSSQHTEGPMLGK